MARTFWWSGDDERAGSHDIYGARVSPAGIVLDPSGIAVSSAANGQAYPALAFDGANFLVVWEEWRGDSSDIYGVRLSPSGTVLDTTGIPISTAANCQWSPALAFDGVNLLVVWEDWRNGSRDIYGARVTRQGTVLDPQGIAMSTAAGWQECPTVAFDGANFLVVWQDYRNGVDYHIYGARVTQEGTVHDEGPVVRQEGGQWKPDLFRCSGGQLLLVYQGWAGTVGGKTYDAYRIWGKMNPVPGVEEREKSEERRVKGGASIVSTVLHLAAQGGHNRNCVPVRGPAPCLLDAAGRKVMGLHPGANDVSRLPSGVYFVRQGQGGHNRNCVPVPTRS